MPAYAHSLIPSTHTMSPLIFDWNHLSLTQTQGGGPVSFAEIGNGYDITATPPRNTGYRIELDFSSTKVDSNGNPAAAHWWITFKHWDAYNKWVVEFLSGGVKVYLTFVSPQIDPATGKGYVGAWSYPTSSLIPAPRRGIYAVSSPLKLRLDFGDYWVKAIDRDNLNNPSTQGVFIAGQSPTEAQFAHPPTHSLRAGLRIGYYLGLSTNESQNWNNVVGKPLP